MQKSSKKLDICRVFCYNYIVKKEVNLNKLSKQQLIEFYIKKCEELDRVQAKFRELQEEHNETLKENERLKEKIALSLQRMFGKKT